MLDSFMNAAILPAFVENYHFDARKLFYPILKYPIPMVTEIFVFFCE